MELNEAISKRIKMLCYDQGISIEHFVTKVNADPQAVIIPIIITLCGNSALLR